MGHHRHHSRRRWLGGHASLALKLVLWYQLLCNGLYRLFVQFYGGVTVVAAALVAATIGCFSLAGRSFFGGLPMPWIVIPIVVLAVCACYGIGRWVGTLPAALLAIVGCGMLAITPSLPPTPLHFQSDMANPQTVASGDLTFLTKGGVVFGLLLGLMYLIYWLRRQDPKPRVRTLRPLWLHATAALLVPGLLGLELLRIVLHALPGFQPPWQKAILDYLNSPGWPYAIAFWLFLEVPLLLSIYDAHLLPRLLHHCGFEWAPNRLSINEAYLVDELLSVMAVPDDQRPRKRSSRQRQGRD